MDDLVSMLDEVTIKKIDKTFSGDSTLKVLAKSVILDYDEQDKNAIVSKLKKINYEEAAYIEEVFDGTIDSSFNVVPAKTGLEFWNNAPQIIINGIAYKDLNEYKLE